MTYLIAAAVDGDNARAADINNAHFASLKEITDAQLFADLIANGYRLCHRLDAADDNAVNMAIGHGVLVGGENVLNKEFAAQPLGIQPFGMVAVNALTNLHDRDSRSNLRA